MRTLYRLSAVKPQIKPRDTLIGTTAVITVSDLLGADTRSGC
jgi:hypothetical protein